MRRVNTLIIGSGCAGLACAARLKALGVSDVLIASDGLACGTSVNTGSDKQTYYKLGIYGSEADSIEDMARDLGAGGAMHGDIALVEAALSVQCFSNLVNLGVPFPHDKFGQFIGYKTDHDPRRRATSCGPYTSQEMCAALLRDCRAKGVEIAEGLHAVKLLKSGGICAGAIFLRDGNFEIIAAENTVLACGGPAGLFEKSVYPESQIGCIGLALEIGAKARNLGLFQFGLASLHPRWNVSGSYMQVVPRFLSDGEELPLPASLVFRKGYQWPFSRAHIPGSSEVDLIVARETAKGRRVFLDFTRNPADFSLDDEARDYLQSAGALGGKTPFERLKILNAPAADFFENLENEPLEIAVCAQHNNGGLACDIWWESENIPRLFAIGEVCGTHGLARPGGSALNSGQVGAFRAAEKIAAEKFCRGKICEDFPELEALRARSVVEASLDYAEEIALLHARSAKFISIEKRDVKSAIDDARKQRARLCAAGLGGLAAEILKLALDCEDLIIAQEAYLAALAEETPRDCVREVVRAADFSFETRNVPARTIPTSADFFETVWRKYRESR